jgi:gamma-glutamylcyclotransferase (GGCT)/AIG2-like uncharacterized protein YtfP
MESKHLIFVYGTLRKDERNHYILKGANCITTKAWTHGKLFDTHLGYPVLQENEEGTVYGELYEISEEQLEKLDELEGYYGENEKNYYERKFQLIYTDSQMFEALLYYKPNEVSRMFKEWIKLGDWRVYNQTKR